MRRLRRFATRSDASQAGRDDVSTGGTDPAGYVRAILIRSHADAYLAGARFQRKISGPQHIEKVAAILRAAGVTPLSIADAAARRRKERDARLAARRLYDARPGEEGPWD